MSRPIGVALIAPALLGASLWTLSHAVAHAGAHRDRSFLIAAAIMTLAGVVAAEALWSLRPHAFLAFMLWAACATVAVVLERLRGPGAAPPPRPVGGGGAVRVAVRGGAAFLRPGP